MMCAFCEIKAERMAGRRKGSVSVGMASGHHAVSATESNTDEEESILSPINLLSSGFIYFAAPLPACLHKLLLLPQPPVFCSARLYVVAETRERGP